jgi:hypothetical protein
MGNYYYGTGSKELGGFHVFIDEIDDDNVHERCGMRKLREGKTAFHLADQGLSAHSKSHQQTRL